MPSHSPFNKAIQILLPVFYQNCTESPNNLQKGPHLAIETSVRNQGSVKCCGWVGGEGLPLARGRGQSRGRHTFGV